MRIAVLAFLAILLNRRVRHRARLTYGCLPIQQHSAWEVLWQSQDEGGLFHTTGFDIHTFRLIAETISPNLFAFLNGRGGRPTRLDLYGHTAMALYYLNSTMQLKTLCQIFSTPPATTQRTLISTLKAMFHALPNFYEARIQWPSPAEMEEYSSMVEARDPSMKNCFGFVDGVWLKIQEPGDVELQNAYYNGWKGCCNISNVVCFAPDGCIIWARYNCPGSWHDNHVAQPLYELLESDDTPDPYFIIADSGFATTDKVQTPLKNGQLSDDPIIAGVQESHHRSLTSARQAAEWGMRSIQGSFQRLKTPLPDNPLLRELILVCVFHLCNLRTRLLEINQIRTVFDPNYIPNIFASRDSFRLNRFYQVD